MKILRQISLGDVDTALVLETVPAPVPGPGEILVTMEIAPIHGRELRLLKDAAPADLPRICGTEGVGRVAALGGGVDNLTIGQRVFPPKYGGLMREQLCCNADLVVAAPEDCAPEALVVAQTMGLTAYLVLADYAALAPGSWVLQNGANSSIGRIVIGLAHERGLKTVNVVRRGGLEDELKALGADAVVVDTGDGAQLARDVAAAAGAPIKVGLDVIGGSASRRLLQCLADGGTLVLSGANSGLAADIHFDDVMHRDIAITGMGMSRSLRRRDAATQRCILDDVARMAADGVFKTPIAGRYALDDYRAAFAHAAQPNAQRNGKVVFVF